MKEKRGLTHLYIGDGKGKTTAAVGLSVRMAGSGGKVLFFQFLKNGESGEIGALQRLGVEVGHTPNGDKFTWQMSPPELEVCKGAVGRCLLELEEAAQSGTYDLIVLDEILDAVNSNMVEDGDLQRVIRGKSPDTELVLTGRNPSPQVSELCDYISEVKSIRHPYQKGITARKGVEY